MTLLIWSHKPVFLELISIFIAKLKLKLKKFSPGTNCQRQRYNTAILKDENKRQEYNITLTNRFQALQNLQEDPNIDEQWKNVKEIITTSCNDILGHKKPCHKEWITPKTLEMIADRKKKKAAVNTSRTRSGKASACEAYTTANRRVKHSIRADKRNYIESLATEAEEAAHHGNLRDLYNTTKKLSRKFASSDRPVKDKQGKDIQIEEGQINRWKEFLKSS